MTCGTGKHVAVLTITGLNIVTDCVSHIAKAFCSRSDIQRADIKNEKTRQLAGVLIDEGNKRCDQN